MRQFQRPFIEFRIYSQFVANILKIFYVLCIYVYIFALYILFAPWSYTSHRLMFFVVNRTENKAYLILSYDARTGIARGTRGVMPIIQPNHKYTAVSSRTGPVDWCDHENSTDVKFLRGLHSALRAINRMGDKNRTGPMVGCDWGISRWTFQEKMALSTLYVGMTVYKGEICSIACIKHCNLIHRGYCLLLCRVSLTDLLPSFVMSCELWNYLSLYCIYQNPINWIFCCGFLNTLNYITYI